MSAHAHGTDALDRLLRVKKLLGLASSKASERGPADESESHTVTCIRCGYDQQGQVINRCPECGLLWALNYRDPTLWASDRATVVSWLSTAAKTWTWDKRCRVRTSLVPATPDAVRFSSWAILVASVPFGLALALLAVCRVAGGQSTALLFVPALVLGFLISALLLLVFVRLLAYSVTGTWRREAFVPASVHYSTAWWLPLGVATLMVSARAIISDARIVVPAVMVALVVLLLWFNWLWLSISESQLVRRALPRVLTVVAVFGLALWPLVHHVNGSVQRFRTAARSLALSPQAALTWYGAPGSKLVSRVPRTFALVIDVIPGGDEELILSCIDALGAGVRDRLVIRGGECTMARIWDAFNAARRDLSKTDRLILYVNGHGGGVGAGVIQMADGYLTSQSLSDLLADLPTPNCLVVIDSCFGGKFVRALRGNCSTAILASTDQNNISFRSGLAPFWRALGKDSSDRNRDGKVTIEEAVWAAYPDMLRRGERARQGHLQRQRLDPRDLWLMSEHGCMTPQFDVFGEADPSAFSVAVQQRAIDSDNGDSP